MSTPALSVPRWEYSSIGLLTNDANQQQRWLNEMGSQGWELVATQRLEHPAPDIPEQRFYFKRQLPTEAPNG